MKKLLILFSLIFLITQYSWAIGETSYIEGFSIEQRTPFLAITGISPEYFISNSEMLNGFSPEYFISNASTFIFNLSEIKSDYFRYKKLTELYPQLSDYYFGSYEYWYNLALLENDVYYRQPNLEYLKFKKLAEKYK